MDLPRATAIHYFRWFCPTQVSEMKNFAAGLQYRAAVFVFVKGERELRSHMDTNKNASSVHRGGLRVWPGVAGATLIAVGFLLQSTVAAAALPGIIGVLVGTIAVFVWWLFLSGAAWRERLAAIVLMIVVWFVVRPFLHFSIIGGAMGAMPVLAFTVLAAGLGFGVWGTRQFSSGVRLVSVALVLLVAGGFCTLVRTAGIGRNLFEFHWRWTPTPEELLLARENAAPSALVSLDQPPPGPPAPAEPGATSPAPVSVPKVVSNGNDAPSTSPSAETPPEWPGFRGPDRDGVVRGLRIDTDWSNSPPVELWREPIGPGWSSFAVAGNLVYTQEQRGEDEIVSAYQLSTGKPVWRHRNAVRFYESNGGAGPRGTPTLSEGRVYTFGATGLLNALDAGTGAVIWSRDVSSDTKVAVPMWGFSSSPLVVDDDVVVAAEGTLAAYDARTGAPRWTGPEGGFSYSSPQLVTVDGVRQILMLSGNGAVSMAPSDGALLWRVETGGGAIVQPAVMSDGNVLIPSLAVTGGLGIQRMALSHAEAGWSVTERWMSNALKPYFNDFVVHKNHAYGFDGNILSCINLDDGKRQWKGGRYGSGQLVLLADQDLLLVVSDEGELVLVNATPDEFKEISRFKAIDGKTWNHPVLVHDVLLVRNGEEMAAFRLQTKP